MNTELMEALEVLEKEKNISKDTLLEAIEQSLIQACKNHFGKADNVKVSINAQTGDFKVVAEKTVVDLVQDPIMEIALSDAKRADSRYELGDIVPVEIKSKEFGRIATQNAKNVILQKIREEERKVLFDQYFEKEHDVVTGVVQRYVGRNVSINLGKVDALLTENEQVKGEKFEPTQRVKVYVLEVKNTTKGPNVDAVGACVGMNGSRVNAVVNELNGEKIDIITWDENPALLIENALSPAKVISVMADPDEKTAKVIVPDYQLSLAIGKEGQNARLAARLTGFKIDIKSETQAREAGDFDYVEEEEYEEEGNYDESAAEEETISVEEDFDENDVETAEKAGDEE